MFLDSSNHEKIMDIVSITWDVSLEKIGIGFEESVEFPCSVSESCIGNVEEIAIFR